MPLPDLRNKRCFGSDCAELLRECGEIDITFQGEQGDQILPLAGNRVLARLSVGNSFGEYAFFTGLCRTSSAKSQGFSKAYRIKRIDMITVLNQFHPDREMFASIKDNMALYGNAS